MNSEDNSISSISLDGSHSENDSDIIDRDSDTYENETVDFAAARQWQEIDLYNVPPSPPCITLLEHPS